jgi:hypothetical protein
MQEYKDAQQCKCINTPWIWMVDAVVAEAAGVSTDFERLDIC